MSDAGSPFLEVPRSDWIAANDSAFAIADGFPVSPGHALIVPHRLVATWWDATKDERSDILSLVDEVKVLLDAERAPDGYNVGFNSGAAAGQTVTHLHVHVIPRYAGDVPNPRGGIRFVIPNMANYLEPDRPSFTLVDGQSRVLRDDILRCCRDSRFDRVDLLVSFIMKSGWAAISSALADALDRGAQLRVLTTDYLNVTDPDALAQLLDLIETRQARVAVRVFHDPATSFHPKAYLFHSSTVSTAAAFVGSNNLSRSGISGGIEWATEVSDVRPMLTSFGRLWEDERSTPLTHGFLAQYRLGRPPAPQVTGVLPEPPAAQPDPRPLQKEALAALEQTRLQGFQRGLVVMATGLGKTWLAAFDTARPQFRRVLFVAHRDEILRQALDVFRRVQPAADLELYIGGTKEGDAAILFASVQTLARNLHSFDPEQFDYVVIDEFHHAAAQSYRKIIDHFKGAFLLGLTATPNRMDGADLLALCSDNLVFECPLTDGIAKGELSPFNYFGIVDDVDYAAIPWRGGRFDTTVLTLAVETQLRAQHALDVWRGHAGNRTLGFCVTVAHADFMADFFSQAGIQAAAVHSGPSSEPRRSSIDRLRSGDLQAIFTVDLFNEGLDVPEIDTVLMLRPTESPVVFLQQLGRGLRKTAAKTALTAIDFIGNHRSFLIKPRTLLALGTSEQPTTARLFRAMQTGDFSLPAGCSVNYEPELVDILKSVSRVGLRSALEDYCRSYFEERGHRPTAVQAYEAGYNPTSARARHGNWFGFLDDLALLQPAEAAVSRQHGSLLTDLEKADTNKSYKLVTVQAMLRLGALRSGSGISELSMTAHHIVASDPRLVADTRSKELPEPATAPADVWRDYWVRWPLSAWAGLFSGKAGRFRIDGSRFVPTFNIADEIGGTFDLMVQEVVDYRLARYLLMRSSNSPVRARLRVTHAGRRPIIMLDRDRNPHLPEGEATFVSDGAVYTGNFAKIALNVARQAGQTQNQLPDLLWHWFGPHAGQPGTSFYVEIVLDDGHLQMRPLRQTPPDLVASEPQVGG